jgi:hypothetical protein
LEDFTLLYRLAWHDGREFVILMAAQTSNGEGMTHRQITCCVWVKTSHGHDLIKTSSLFKPSTF